MLIGFKKGASLASDGHEGLGGLGSVLCQLLPTSLACKQISDNIYNLR